MPNRPTISDLPGPPLAAEDLTAAYLQAVGDDLLWQARVLWWSFRLDEELERSTADRMGPIVASFAARQRTLGRRRLTEATPEDAAAFVWARTRRGDDPAISTVHLRRTALRLLFRKLATFEGHSGDPTIGLSLPPRTRAELRPLDDDEIGLLRLAAASRQRGRGIAEATIALAEATATTGEIATLAWHHLADAALVDLPGIGRVQPRIAPLTDWGSAALTRWAPTRPRPDASVVYRGEAAPGSQTAQASVVNRLRVLLHSAGLHEPDIRPTSIRLWRPARELAGGARIEDVARMLGFTSLDVTCSTLGHDWTGH